jgi:hypothetical protein
MYVLITQEIQDGENEYKIYNLESYMDETNLIIQIGIEGASAARLYEEKNCALRSYKMQELTEEDYNVLRKHI